MGKRLFDIFFAGLGLAILSPLFLIIAALIKLDSEGTVLFRQERIGRRFKPFNILKFRSMISDAPGKGPSITVGGDHRVTRAGRFLRKYKIDELPQLINVFIGDMSLVGPRPEVRKYVELFRKDYEKLLTVRPGITDPASISYSGEETLLASAAAEWEEVYIAQILPNKIRIATAYIEENNLLYDIRLIVKTLSKIHGKH